MYCLKNTFFLIKAIEIREFLSFSCCLYIPYIFYYFSIDKQMGFCYRISSRVLKKYK
jgi:hypothetical protein